MVDPVVNHGVVLASGQLDTYSHRCVACETELRHIGIIVVMDRVIADHRAGSGSRWAHLTSRAGPILRRGPVVVVEAIGEDTNPVLIPFAVLDDEVTTRIGSRIAKWAVLRMHMRDDDVTVSTPPDIERRIAHIARVVIFEPARAADVAGEDAIDRLSGRVILVVGRAGGQVASQERPHADGAT